MKKYFDKVISSLLVTFLLFFMLFIFGPSEIYFSNLGQFEFLFKEYFFTMLALGIGCTFVTAAIIALLPEKIHGIVLSVIAGFSVGGYVQVMFLNKDLDLLGLNPDGNRTTTGQIVINMIIWIVIIAAFVIVSVLKKDIAKKVNMGVAGFLIAIQLVALISLIPQADESAFKRDAGVWRISAEKQLAISPNNNLIVIILDYFSNQYVEPMLAEYPDALDCMHDFTYYDNTECVYHGTYPSVIHMLTGYEMDPNIATNDWIKDAWHSDNSEDFYSMLASNDYKLYFFTPEPEVLSGTNEHKDTIYGKVSNLTNNNLDAKIDNGLLIKCMSQISCYRFMPLAMKNMFYVDNSDIKGIVSFAEYTRLHSNCDFYDGLLSKGLYIDEDAANIISIQHLEGAHDWSTSWDAKKKEGASVEETCRGCFTVLDEYFNQLKELGKYDDATIIVTSDHGSLEEPQSIMFVKYPHESSSDMKISHAPISHCDFLPTMAKIVSGDGSMYGTSIDEIAEDEPRLRACWEHVWDDRYPSTKNAFYDKDGANNVYHIYTYDGDFTVLGRMIKDKDATYIIQMFDSFS